DDKTDASGQLQRSCRLQLGSCKAQAKDLEATKASSHPTRGGRLTQGRTGTGSKPTLWASLRKALTKTDCVSGLQPALGILDAEHGPIRAQARAAHDSPECYHRANERAWSCLGPNGYVDGGKIIVESAVEFKDLSVEEFSDPTFKHDFEESFKVQMASSAKCHTDDVIIHSIVAGSIIVNSSVELSDVTEQAAAEDFAIQLKENVSSIFTTEQLDQYGGVASSDVITEVVYPPPPPPSPPPPPFPPPLPPSPPLPSPRPPPSHPPPLPPGMTAFPTDSPTDYPTATPTHSPIASPTFSPTPEEASDSDSDSDSSDTDSAAELGLLSPTSDSDSPSSELNGTELALVIVGVLVVVALLSAFAAHRVLHKGAGRMPCIGAEKGVTSPEEEEEEDEHMSAERARFQRTFTNLPERKRYSDVQLDYLSVMVPESKDDELDIGIQNPLFAVDAETLWGSGSRDSGVRRDSERRGSRYSGVRQASHSLQSINPLLKPYSLKEAAPPAEFLMAMNPTFNEEDADVFNPMDQPDRPNYEVDSEIQHGPPHEPLTLSEAELAELSQCNGREVFQMMFQNLDGEMQALVQRASELAHEHRRHLLDLMQLINAELERMWELAEQIAPGDTEGLEALAARASTLFGLLERAYQFLEDASGSEAVPAGDARSRAPDMVQAPELVDPEGTTEQTRHLLEQMKMMLKPVETASKGPKEKNSILAISADVSPELRNKLVAQRFKVRESIHLASNTPSPPDKDAGAPPLRMQFMRIDKPRC
ncbi:hypothetical protein CYMTET_33148, partial [Cymbomonas tetramitiformis]